MIEWIVRKFFNRSKSDLDNPLERRKDHVTRKIINILDEFGARFQYYEAIIQSCRDCIVRSDLDGLVIFANKSYANVFCGVADITSCNNTMFLRHIFEKDLDKIKDDLQSIQNPPYQVIRDLRIIDHKGNLKAFNWHIFGIRDKDGVVSEAQLIGREFPNFVQWGKLEDFTL